MTAPTGAGKTLAMIGFALAHTKRHDLRRVILALPFLSIVEQTASLLSTIFGGAPEGYLLEHHSLAGLRDQDDDATHAVGSAREQARRFSSENWDAPVIVTTNVQLFESLFSNRPKSLRKLHRIARSVVLLDEIQSLPAHLAVPTVAALQHLGLRFGTTPVIVTATQPAFTRLSPQIGKPVGELPVQGVRCRCLRLPDLRRKTPGPRGCRGRAGHPAGPRMPRAALLYPSPLARQGPPGPVLKDGYGVVTLHGVACLLPGFNVDGRFHFMIEPTFSRSSIPVTLAR